jgi:hypothetical protein
MFSQRRPVEKLSRLRYVLIGALSASGVSLVLAVCPAAHASLRATAASQGRTARSVEFRADKSKCTLLNPRCFRYAGTYKTLGGCAANGQDITGTTVLFKCVPLPPSGHYELWIYDNRL